MKRLLWIILVILLLAVILFVAYLRFVLPSVGPAPDITVEATPERLMRGEYLATKVMGCVDCHTQRDFTKYSGPISAVPFSGGSLDEFTEEAGLPGNFYAANLTPYYLGDWTDGEIYRAITAGVTKDGRALFPVMPYHMYAQASEEDILSVIAYLRTLEPYEKNVPKSKAQFPVSLLVNTMPKKAKHGEIPSKENRIEYGKYLITVAACVDCHTPMVKGKFVMEEAYSGGLEFILPTGIVRSTNITPDKETGIGSWTEEMFVSRFKAHADSLFIPEEVPDGGFNTSMPWTMYAKMEEDDLKSIYAYLHSLEPQKKQIVRFSPKE
jgi:mono/diheme cytochrome c family protein